MAKRAFQNCRVLVVEDEYLLAEDLREELIEGGAAVIGPAQTVARALELVASPGRLDAAVLDINLGGELAYPVADALAERGVPFLFTTGYDSSALPDRFNTVNRCEKPVDMKRMMDLVGGLCERLSGSVAARSTDLL